MNNKRLRVGLTFNLRRIAVAQGDSEAEFDAPTTIEAIAHAIRQQGHDVFPCEANRELPRVLSELSPDLVFNVAEGLHGLNREAQVPALCELLEIEFTGSDAACMAISLNKATAKRQVAFEGIRTPAFAVLRTGLEALPGDFAYPAIVKPIAEGSSKGILEKQVVESEAELRQVSEVLLARYRQPVLAEAFLPGREFTVAMLGERDPRVLPIMEIVFTDQSERFPIYSFKSKFESIGVENKVPCDVTPELYRELERVAKASFAALGCRDIARVDLRLDAEGNVHFIECNPLPGMAPNFSDLCVMAKVENLSYDSLVAEIMSPAVARVFSRI
ncbi:MAG: D-alanine--D-alanine ligase [Myxococcaceae bacterium]|nr:D-alanine--D-alanine ligase [Myxococcaceae bacterium]